MGGSGYPVGDCLYISRYAQTGCSILALFANLKYRKPDAYTPWFKDEKKGRRRGDFLRIQATKVILVPIGCRVSEWGFGHVFQHREAPT